MHLRESPSTTFPARGQQHFHLRAVVPQLLYTQGLSSARAPIELTPIEDHPDFHALCHFVA
eukprot:2645141-Karenia_brevis.AAC.1